MSRFIRFSSAIVASVPKLAIRPFATASAGSVVQVSLASISLSFASKTLS